MSAAIPGTLAQQTTADFCPCHADLPLSSLPVKGGAVGGDGCLYLRSTVVDRDYNKLAPFVRHEAEYNPEVMPVQCKIIEVANIEDATGYPCASEASERCSDCGTPLCDAHGETCASCGGVFCATCLAFHNREQHQKKSARVPERKRRKSA